MALDPNISLGVRQMELANPLAQYGQIAAIQNAQNQNALAQFQLGSAQRQEEAQNALSESYRKSINPDTGQFDPKLLIGNIAQSKAAHLLPDIQAKLLDAESKQATMAKTRQETSAGEFKLTQDKLKHGWNSLGDSPTPQDAIKKLNEGVTKGYFDFSTANAEAQKLQNMTLEQYKQYRVEKVMGLLEAKDKLSFMLPKTRDRDIGGAIQTIQDNPMMPGYGMPVAGMAATPKTPTFAEQTGQGQLNLARAKFDFEKANPTLSIQEDPSGLLAVNMRTGMAIPVVYGPTGFQAAPAAGTAPAPAAAPGASMMRQPPAALPGQRTPAIPGMASVLDQTAAPVTPAGMPMPSTTGERVPGQPVTAKKSMPEAYAKQAMGVANTNDALEKMQSTMKNFKSSDMLNPTRRAELGQAHATTLLFAKELFNLGVLNGGDERIVNSVINNPVDFSSTAVPIEAIRKQARDLQGVVDRTNKNLSLVYKMPLLKLERSTPSEVSSDIHSQAEAILRGTP
jgi:hypothetical protein